MTSLNAPAHADESSAGACRLQHSCAFDQLPAFGRFQTHNSRMVSALWSAGFDVSRFT